MIILLIFLIGLVFVVIINTEQSSGESQNLAEGDENGVVNFAGRRYDKTSYQQSAANDYQEYGCDELQGRFVLYDIHNMMIIE